MNIMECLGENKEGILTIGGVSVKSLAEKYGTPLYIMDEDEIRKNCKTYKNAIDTYYGNGSLVLYASKAFTCKYMCKLVAEEGLGIDVVSGGELYTALKAGFPAEKIYFHGNNKTNDEIRLAIDNNVGRIVVDNLAELDRLNEYAKMANKVVNISFRIKPGIDAHTHEFVMTGQIDSKFGVALETGEAEQAYADASKLSNINVIGVHCHIGSQIFDYAPFEMAASKMMHFIADLKHKYNIEIEELNLGGGYGIKYTENDTPVPYDQYIQQISVIVKKVSEEKHVKLPKILMEPGRSIVAPAGITVYTVGAIKDIPNIRRYVSVDGGMADNPRYIMYESKYKALVVTNPNGEENETVTIAGKCCESGDLLIKDAIMPKINNGDLIAVLATGAYNYSMASNYNRIPKPPVIMVSNGESKVVVERESYEDIIKNDRGWLSAV